RLPRHGNTGLYGVIDQMIWRLSGGIPKRGVGLFARAMAAPSDRNLIDLYADAGVNFTGLWDLRPDDTFGMAASYSRISPAARGDDADAAFFTSAPLAVRDDLRAYLSSPDCPWLSRSAGFPIYLSPCRRRAQSAQAGCGPHFRRRCFWPAHNDQILDAIAVRQRVKERRGYASKALRVSSPA